MNGWKKITSVAALLVLFAIPFGANAGYQGCEIKKSKIRQQMTYAREHGYAFRLRGLERALARTRARCRNNILAEKPGQSVADKAYQVRRRQMELARAKENGNLLRIVEKAKSLAEARQELQQARAALQQSR